jgi:phosphoribosylanthranilate isomerase
VVSRGRVVATEIKFCGLTRAEDAAYAASLGAAYTGVIFAGGPRSLTVERAAEVLSAVQRDVKRTAVFADQSEDEIASIAGRLQLDVVQLHGASSVQRIEALREKFAGEIWPVCRVSGASIPADVVELARAGDRLVLDSFVPGALGGTGVAMPWDSLADDVERLRASGRTIVLAGGLRPDNVATAIRTLSPAIVDVSSGVERAPGIKNHDRMRAFRDAVAATNHS